MVKHHQNNSTTPTETKPAETTTPTVHKNNSGNKTGVIQNVGKKLAPNHERNSGNKTGAIQNVGKKLAPKKAKKKSKWNIF